MLTAIPRKTGFYLLLLMPPKSNHAQGEIFKGVYLMTKMKSKPNRLKRAQTLPKPLTAATLNFTKQPIIIIPK